MWRGDLSPLGCVAVPLLIFRAGPLRDPAGINPLATYFLSPQIFTHQSILLIREWVAVLEALHGNRTRRSLRPRLAIRAGLAVLAAVSAVHQAALGFAALPCFTTDTRRAAGTASHVDFDQLGREIPWYGEAYLCTRRAWLAIAAVTAIGAVAG